MEKIENTYIDIEEDTEHIMKKLKDFAIEKDISIDKKIKKIEELKEKYNITYKESCKVLKVSERTFRRKRKDGRFKSVHKRSRR